MAELTEEEERARGEKLVNLLGLKPERGTEVFLEPRYPTSVGNKTALGLYRTVGYLIFSA